MPRTLHHQTIQACEKSLKKHLGKDQEGNGKKQNKTPTKKPQTSKQNKKNSESAVSLEILHAQGESVKA